MCFIGFKKVPMYCRPSPSPPYDPLSTHQHTIAHGCIDSPATRGVDVTSRPALPRRAHGVNPIVPPPPPTTLPPPPWRANQRTPAPGQPPTPPPAPAQPPTPTVAPLPQHMTMPMPSDPAASLQHYIQQLASLHTLSASVTGQMQSQLADPHGVFLRSTRDLLADLQDLHVNMLDKKQKIQQLQHFLLASPVSVPAAPPPIPVVYFAAQQHTTSLPVPEFPPIPPVDPRPRPTAYPMKAPPPATMPTKAKVPAKVYPTKAPMKELPVKAMPVTQIPMKKPPPTPAVAAKPEHDKMPARILQSKKKRKVGGRSVETDPYVVEG